MKMQFDGDHLTSAEWDVLGKETGRLRYEHPNAYGDMATCYREELRAYGDMATCYREELRNMFRLWPDKPRLFLQFEGGEVEITKDVWR